MRAVDHLSCGNLTPIKIIGAISQSKMIISKMQESALSHNRLKERYLNPHSQTRISSVMKLWQLLARPYNVFSSRRERSRKK